MYKKRIILRSITKALKDGAGLWNACKGAGITPMTFWRWRKNNPRIDNLVNKILEGRTQLVIDALYKNALEGKIPAQIFWLKNRQIEKWREKREYNINNNHNIEVIDFDFDDYDDFEDKESKDNENKKSES